MILTGLQVPGNQVAGNIRHLSCQTMDAEAPWHPDHADRAREGSTDSHCRNPDGHRLSCNLVFADAFSISYGSLPYGIPATDYKCTIYAGAAEQDEN